MGISIMGTSWDIPIIFRLNNNHRCPTIIYFYEGFKDEGFKDGCLLWGFAENSQKKDQQ